MKRILSLTAVLLLLGSQVYAVSSSKSVNQLSKLSEKDLLALIKSGCTNITYNGPTVVGTLCPVATVPANPVPVTPVPPNTPPVSSAGEPTDLVGQNWTEMLPYLKSGSSEPQNEYLSVAQTDPKAAPYLYMNNGAIVFKTPVNGAHSPNSSYPRSELREMKDTNWTNASWTNSGVGETLTVKESIDHEPVVKPEVVSAQIHDGSDDVIQVFLQGSKLFVRYDNDNSLALMDATYALGTPFDLQVVGSGGHVKVSYNGVQKLDWAKNGSGWYWKVGSYCQSNVSKGDAPDAYCQVSVYSLGVK